MLTVHASEPMALAELASRGGIFVLGLVVVMISLVSLMRTVIVPRPLRSSLSGLVMWLVEYTTRGIAYLRGTYAKRDHVLAWTGPVMILAMLIAWLIGFLVGYAMLIYGVSGMDFGDALRQSGSSLLTLGFAGGVNEDQTIIDFIAAATGPIIIAMLIGYLPTIFQTYLEREVLVTMLSTSGGEPAWGPEYLARATLSGTLDQALDHMDAWAEWAARLRLTHITYPTLMFVRSPRATRHYLISLLCVMDAAALQISLSSTVERMHAYRLLLQGSQTFESLYVVTHRDGRGLRRIPVVNRLLQSRDAQDRASHLPAWSLDTRAVHEAAAQDNAVGFSTLNATTTSVLGLHDSTITHDQFMRAVTMLQAVNYPINRSLDEAWTMFRDIRSQYEFPAYALAYRLDAVPAPWSGPRYKRTDIIYPASAGARRTALGSLDEPGDTPAP
ncbi:MAG: hypothetical protein PHU75_09470 [Candidatus Nanopelagicales bacterium]|nr:hypothetical protein [Candidatus Nanopelagicales bacterium]